LPSMVSMMDILPGAVPLMVDVRQSGSGPASQPTSLARPTGIGKGLAHLHRLGS
jgi:hypothetical protein